MKRKLFCLVFIQWLTCYAKGSDVVLDVSSPYIIPGLTPSLTLRCALNDSEQMSSSSGALIGRDLTHTTHDVQFITSLSITYNGTNVAMVTEHIPAHASSGSAAVMVEGGISGTPGERGYLSVTWPYPGEGVQGEYRCEVTALDGGGHSVVFSTAGAVELREPSMADLVQHIHTLELQTHSQAVLLNQTMQHNQALEQLAHNQATMLNQTVQHIHSLELQTHSQEVLLNQTIGQLNDLKRETKHIEKGTLSCGHVDVDTWDKSGNMWFKSLQHSFVNRYQKAPVVFLSTNGISMFQDQHQGHSVSLVQVDAQGFTMRCNTWHTYVLTGMSVDWISFAQ